MARLAHLYYGEGNSDDCAFRFRAAMTSTPLLVLLWPLRAERYAMAKASTGVDRPTRRDALFTRRSRLYRCHMTPSGLPARPAARRRVATISFSHQSGLSARLSRPHFGGSHASRSWSRQLRRHTRRRPPGRKCISPFSASRLSPSRQRQFPLASPHTPARASTARLCAAARRSTTTSGHDILSSSRLTARGRRDVAFAHGRVPTMPSAIMGFGSVDHR